MELQTTPNTNFQGGFRFKNMPPKATEELSEIAKRGKQIFLDFENKGDVFVVTRDKLDKKMADFIAKKRLKFEYYKSINTNSKLDDQIPELLSALLDTIKETPITKLSALKKFLNYEPPKMRIKKVKPEINTDTILKTLCIDNKHEIRTYKGAKVVNDTEFNRKIFITPAKDDVHYVLVEPNSKNLSAKRYAISTDGTILHTFETPDKMKVFRKKFKSLLTQ